MQGFEISSFQGLKKQSVEVVNFYFTRLNLLRLCISKDVSMMFLKIKRLLSVGHFDGGFFGFRFFVCFPYR